jgi:hypothetical protein
MPDGLAGKSRRKRVGAPRVCGVSEPYIIRTVSTVVSRWRGGKEYSWREEGLVNCNRTIRSEVSIIRVICII